MIESALQQHGAQAVASGRLTELRGAVETFGFHLATVDLQNPAVHEQVVDEMLRIGGVCASYLALDEPQRVEVLSAEMATARPLLGVTSVVGNWPRASSRFSVRPPTHCDLWSQRHRELHHLQMRVRLDVLEVAVLFREVGLLRHATPTRRQSRFTEPAIGIVPLFETIADLQRASEVVDVVVAPGYNKWPINATACSEDARYSDSNKRLRTSPPTGPVSMPGGSGRGVATPLCEASGSSTVAVALSAAAEGPVTTRHAQPSGSVQVGLRMTEQGR